jgi:hypothetical protein
MFSEMPLIDVLTSICWLILSPHYIALIGRSHPTSTDFFGTEGHIFLFKSTNKKDLAQGDGDSPHPFSVNVTTAILSLQQSRTESPSANQQQYLI